eukprot:134113-Pyramimonas_sp.AAC.2
MSPPTRVNTMVVLVSCQLSWHVRPLQLDCASELNRCCFTECIFPTGASPPGGVTTRAWRSVLPALPNDM